MSNMEIGIVIEVKGHLNKIATFDNTNHSNFIKDGKVIKNVSVNSFIVINQGFLKIVARINSESIWDTQSNLKDFEFDNRFKKNSIKRILEVQVIGYIKNNKFYSGISFLPMIGNICSIPNNDEINQIYINNYIEDENSKTINVGKSLIENNMINLPINSFFASHIGIFGNSGSGKSNTLHKLYYGLFSNKELYKIKENSLFLILDFNGEYTQRNSFGISEGEFKKIYNLSSRKDHPDKYPIDKATFLNDEILSTIFQATTQTQKPFLSRVLKGIKKYELCITSLSNWIEYLIKSIFTGNPNLDLRDRLLGILESYFPEIEDSIAQIKSSEVFSKDGKPCFRIVKLKCYFDGSLSDKHIDALNIKEIRTHINKNELNLFKLFEISCKLRLVNDLCFNNVVPEHIDPLLKRIETRLISIENYIDIVDDKEAHFIEVVSLKNLNQEAKKILSILISKMSYDIHKTKNINNTKSFHLIIDEAHNILSNQSIREHESWKDYRLELFEEIIKEGRKFSFFLTLSSQRPADISPTILSQVHNFFLHKLVNDKDLLIIDNSISTLDKISKSMLPILSQGSCIISGTAITMPIIVNIDFIEDITLRPKSDTILLTDIWK